MKYAADTIEEWISRVNEEGRGLNSWERNFMESVTEQFDRRRWLSEGQIDRLETIYIQKVP
jgi:hypothetical protein